MVKMTNNAIVNRRRVITPHGGDSRVQPQHAAACSIKSIMEKHRALGINPMRPLDPAMCGNTERITFAEAFNIVENATASFMDLPARVRERFANNPAELFDFISDEKNRAEAESIGLIRPKEAKPVTTDDLTKAVADIKSDKKTAEKAAADQ